jgi:hypothetical protein
MPVDLESWIIETGDIVIQKMDEEGTSSLTSTEQAIYWMWSIDYAVRNSGSFGPLQDMESTAIHDLHAFATKLASWLESAADEPTFCESYYEQFEKPCCELREAYNGRNTSL